MSSCFKKIIFLIILFSFLIPVLVKAAVLPNPLEWDTIEEVITGIIDFILWIAIALVPLMIIIAGFFFLIAGGNPERINTAKRIIFWTIVGFAIILLAKGIVSMVIDIIGG